MTLNQIKKKYGAPAFDWITQKLVDGTIKPTYHNGKGYFTVRLENPKCKRPFITMRDHFKYVGLDTWELPDIVRFSDIVQVIIDQPQ
jgi:hypothetical protein